MQLTQRQKEILLTLISNEIDETTNDVEDKSDYLDELEDLSEKVFKS